MQQLWRASSPSAFPVARAPGDAISGARISLRTRLLACIVAGILALAALMHWAGLHIEPERASNLPYYAAGLIALSLRLGLPSSRWRHAEPIAQFAEYVALFALISLIGAVASYPVVTLTSGYQDVALQRIDAALGFDWLAWYRAVADHRSLQLIGTAVYRSIYVTPAILLWYFASNGQNQRAYRFLSTFGLAAVITLALFSLMPAVGPFSHLWRGAIPYMPDSELWQPGLIPALRAHSLTVVDLSELRGIVSAPSFHTAAAVLYIAAAWHIAPLRWPILALNAAMLLSTPVEGTHYLVDMILGALAALAAILLMRVGGWMSAER